jgi:hypothetical protein
VKWNAVTSHPFSKRGTAKLKENVMDDDLIARLNTESTDLRQRAQEIDESSDERDTALLMQGLATAMDAIRALAATARRLDGPPGLGKSGD